MSVGVLYYTCLTHDPIIEAACRAQLARVAEGLELGVVSRGQAVDFGDWNIVVHGKRSPETMHAQILAGLQRMESEVVYLCESDVLYHKSHFDCPLTNRNRFWYNTNVWKAWYPGGHATWTDDLQQVSGCCATRELLHQFYRARVNYITVHGFDRHYEPGPKTGPYHTENWQSETCNVDVRHGQTLTRSKRSPDEFRNKRYAKGWKETDDIPDWGLVDRAFLEALADGTI